MPKKSKSAELPSGAGRLAHTYPQVWEAYANLGSSLANAGPLDAKTRRLVKLALAAGAGSEGAVHSHVRRGLDEGLTPEELRHIAILSISTLGLPRAIAALTWIEDIVGKG